MITKGQFTYKGVTHIDAGSFTGSDGKTIDYKGSYRLQVDEITPNGIFERKMKIAEDNLQLVQRLMQLKPYTVIELQFDIEIYNNQARLIPTEFEVLSES